MQDYVHPLHTNCLSSCCSYTFTSICHPSQLIVNPTSACCALPTDSILPPSGPFSYDIAAQFPEWKQVIAAEFSALEADETWSLVPLPKGKKPISCKWVVKVKKHVDGSIERYKARLVVKG